MVKHWDLSLVNLKSGADKFRGRVAGSIRRGALLQYARSRGTLKFVLPYHTGELKHSVFIVLMTTIFFLIVAIPTYRVELSIIGLITFCGYQTFLIIHKRNILSGLIAFPLLTAYVFAVLFGFITRQHTIRWGAQRSEAYLHGVHAINNITADDE